MKTTYAYYAEGFREALKQRPTDERRVGPELKFPLVNPDGSAVAPEIVDALWDFLQECGWRADVDKVSNNVIGACKAGPMNDTVASCETGYCKTEFSLAHAADLHELSERLDDLRTELHAFAERHDVRFLGYGIHPVSPPSERLLMKKKSRTGVWDKIFGANRILAPEDGDDFCLFTINAATHTHISVNEDEAIPAVNVLNGFAGAQQALTAHSPVWRGQIDPNYVCVAEKFWDWWIPEPNRVGVPDHPFKNLQDYADTIDQFRPVFVKRDGRPIIIRGYDTFAEYAQSGSATGEDADGNPVTVTPEPDDVGVHSTCYWWNARISRYYTVENRANDQQPPDSLLGVAALTLGLVSALKEAEEEVQSYDWPTLQQSRDAACRDGLRGRVGDLALKDLSGRVLDLARKGLRRRGRGEEEFLAPFEERLREQRCPGDEVRELFRRSGVDGLVQTRSL